MGSIYVFLAFLESTMVAHALRKILCAAYLLDLQQGKSCNDRLIDAFTHISTPMPISSHRQNGIRDNLR